jgi:pyruvate/2-oxoglutarate dehydrogenase complex dihydrolipoamide acyltransferase (E2) component
MDVVNNKEDADNFLKEEADDEMALEALRKQRKMAKKILLDKRKNSLFTGEKATYMKRFTQQMDSTKMTPNHMLSRNLSEINEGEGS